MDVSFVTIDIVKFPDIGIEMHIKECGAITVGLLDGKRGLYAMRP